MAKTNLHPNRHLISRTSLLSREVIPFALMLLALIGAALAVDAGLHLAGLVWIGRYLGIPGVVLILASSAYSLRKHKVISSGKPVTLLRLHERLAWAGSLLILVHAGVHFNAVLAWLAIAAMLINVASGLTGKYLMGPSHKRLAANRARLAWTGTGTAGRGAGPAGGVETGDGARGSDPAPWQRASPLPRAPPQPAVLPVLL